MLDFSGKLFGIAGAILLGMSWGGCSRSSSGESQTQPLMVSIEPLRYFAERIAGPDYDVEVMLTGSADPETFEPSLERRAAADRAPLYFATGHLPFEEKLRGSMPGKSTWVDTSHGVELIYGTHGDAAEEHHHDGDCDHHHHNHGGADPHVWTSVTGAKIIASNIAEALIEYAPADSAAFRGRFESLVQSLDSLDSAIRSKLADAPDAFAIWHPSLSYFARDYGLRQIAVGYEAKEMPARTLRAAVDSTRAAGAKVMFVERSSDSRQANALAKETATRLVTIDPLASDWSAQMLHIADELARP